MRLLLCLDGYATASLLERATWLLNLPAADMLAVHVRDTGPRGALELARGAILGAPRLGRDRGQEIDTAERERALAVVAEAEAELAARSLRGDVRLEEGVPEKLIVSLAARQHVDAVVLFARRGGLPPGAGPHSLGHTARYVVDHAPCAVLLLR